jgi:hypothetical protein
MLPRITLAAAICVCMVAPNAFSAIIGGPIANPANGHTYYLLNADTWTNSESQAQALGGHLVTINDSAEETFLINTFTSGANANRVLWLGLNDAATEGTFAWADGTPFNGSSYGHTFGSFPWAPGEPNNATDAGPAGEDYVSFNWHYTVPDAPSIYQTIHGTWNDDIETGPAASLAPRHGGALGPFNGVVEVAATIPEPGFPSLVLAGLMISFTLPAIRRHRVPAAVRIAVATH